MYCIGCETATKNGFFYAYCPEFWVEHQNNEKPVKKYIGVCDVTQEKIISEAIVVAPAGAGTSTSSSKRKAAAAAVAVAPYQSADFSNSNCCK